MSKYLEFKQIPFKGKTKRFDVVSKTSTKECFICLDRSINDENLEAFNGAYKDCKECNGTGRISIVLGRVSWYPQWRQYTFNPAFPTTWNRDCMNDIIFFINNLMEERKPKKKRVCGSCDVEIDKCICHGSVLREVSWEATKQVWKESGKYKFEGYLDHKNKQIIITGFKKRKKMKFKKKVIL